MLKSGGIKKKKKHKKHYEQLYTGNNLTTDLTREDFRINADDGNELARGPDDRLTLAERRYLERYQQLETHRLAKSAGKSHRDRVQEFNQYLANLTEHYDIPKVGPG